MTNFLQLPPQQLALLLQQIGIRYSTSAPTGTPNKETEIWVVKTGGLYYIYAWADGAWRRVQIA
jgi:hypothetical protein